LAKTYTAADLREFDRITLKLSAPNQLARINGRMELKKFIETHGQPKCDAMFKEIVARDAKKRRSSGDK